MRKYAVSIVLIREKVVGHSIGHCLDVVDGVNERNAKNKVLSKVLVDSKYIGYKVHTVLAEEII
jgi:hypothetical protein